MSTRGKVVDAVVAMREDTRREKFNEKTMRYAYKFTQTLNTDSY